MGGRPLLQHLPARDQCQNMGPVLVLRGLLLNKSGHRHLREFRVERVLEQLRNDGAAVQECAEFRDGGDAP